MTTSEQRIINVMTSARSEQEAANAAEYYDRAVGDVEACIARAERDHPTSGSADTLATFVAKAILRARLTAEATVTRQVWGARLITRPTDVVTARSEQDAWDIACSDKAWASTMPREVVQATATQSAWVVGETPGINVIR